MRLLTRLRCFVTPVVILHAAIPALAATPAYTFTDLGDLGYQYHVAPQGINDAGVIVGQLTLPSQDPIAFSWQNGSLMPLGSTTWTAAMSINNGGQIVGLEGGSYRHAIQWTSLGWTSLPGPGYAGQSQPSFISNSGATAGFVETSMNIRAGAIWQNDTLTVLPGMFEARGINDALQVVGFSGIQDKQKAISYQSGVYTTICSGTAMAINNNGHIIGYQIDPVSYLQSWPFFYEDGNLSLIGPEGASNRATAINDLDAVVGDFNVAKNINHAFLWQDNTFYDLNSLVSPGPGSYFWTAKGINNQGQITGVYVNSVNAMRGYLLTPVLVPEPSMLSLFSFGCLPLLTRRRKAPPHPSK